MTLSPIPGRVSPVSIWTVEGEGWKAATYNYNRVKMGLCTVLFPKDDSGLSTARKDMAIVAIGLNRPKIVGVGGIV